MERRRRMERAKRYWNAEGVWNAAGFSLLLGASGTRKAQLEQLGTIWNYLERRRL